MLPSSLGTARLKKSQSAITPACTFDTSILLFWSPKPKQQTCYFKFWSKEFECDLPVACWSHIRGLFGAHLHLVARVTGLFIFFWGGGFTTRMETKQQMLQANNDEEQCWTCAAGHLHCAELQGCSETAWEMALLLLSKFNQNPSPLSFMALTCLTFLNVIYPKLKLFSGSFSFWCRQGASIKFEKRVWLLLKVSLCHCMCSLFCEGMQEIFLPLKHTMV